MNIGDNISIVKSKSWKQRYIKIQQGSGELPCLSKKQMIQFFSSMVCAALESIELGRISLLCRIKELASLINYTNLSNMITEGEMREFLEKAKELNFNSVVISPTYIPLAKEILADTNIKVGSVVGFPLGFEDTESKVAEAKELVEKGADEVEVVINLS